MNMFTSSKSSYRFITLSIKRSIIPTIFCLFTICLVIFSKSNFTAVQDGLALWGNSIVPSLLPFFIATELLGYTNVVTRLGIFFNPIMRPLFHVPGIGSFALIMGIISGYPTGAKIVVNLRQQGLCTKEEAERMLAFTNNSGPLFILGSVGISMFGNSTIGFLLLLTHILASITVGIVFRFYKYKDGSYKHISNVSTNYIQKENIDFSNLGSILGKSIMSAIKTVVMIGGFVVLFSVVLSILKSSNIINIFSKIIFPLFKILGINNLNFSSEFLCGILELTNGIFQITSIAYKEISTNVILVSFLLGFGGFSVLLQVYSIIANSDISIKGYFLGKLLHGILASFYTFLFITYVPVFNLNL